jgi:signal transduction histidine kinase/ActR/RegA family two-component response regulator
MMMMIPRKIQNTFIEIKLNFEGEIVDIISGLLCVKEFRVNQSIYPVCPFLEETLEVLPIEEPFTMIGFVIQSENKEYNVEVELLKSAESITLLIENRTNIYQYLIQLNQHRNDISLVKEQIEKQNIELASLKKIAEKANEQKSIFLAIMSHEVRNPLNVILAYIDIILSETNQQKIKKYANLLKSSGKNLYVIVNDILDISKIDAGKLELNRKPISIKEVVTNCVESFKIQYQKSDIKLGVTFSGKLPEFVLGDSVRIEQILSNLIKNAYKFTQKGQINIKIAVSSDTPESCKINFKIEDSGRGMTQEQLSRVFHEYEQSELNDFTISKGAGLGLSIVKKIVETKKGTVGVESVAGVGSVFHFEIPFKKTKKIEKELIIEIKQDLASLTILFADDDILNQSIVKYFLEKEHINVTLVSNGLDALKALRTTVFDLVLLDIQMPNLTGEELVNKQPFFLELNREIPLIAVTANVSAKDIERYKNAGFKDVLPKPFNAKQLTSILQKNRK